MVTLIVTVVSWLVFGFLAGLIARAVYPGPQPMTFLQTAGVGIAGSFIGGAIGSLIFGRAFTGFHPAGFIGSVIGALVLLFLLGVSRRSGGRRAARR